MRKIVSLVIALMCNCTNIDAILLETDRLIFVKARSLDQLNENEEIYKLLSSEIDFESYTEIYSKLINFFNAYESINEKDIFWGDYYIYLKKDASLIGFYSIYPPSVHEIDCNGYSSVNIYFLEEYKNNGYQDEILYSITQDIKKYIGTNYSDFLNNLMQDIHKDTNYNDENVNFRYTKETGVFKGIFVKTQHEYENFKAALNCGFVPNKTKNPCFKFDCNLPEIFSFFPSKKQNDLSILEISSLEQLIFELKNVQEQLLSELKNLLSEKLNENEILEQKISELKKLDCFKNQEQFLLESENSLLNESILVENELEGKLDKQSEIKEKIKALIFN